MRIVYVTLTLSTVSIIGLVVPANAICVPVLSNSMTMLGTGGYHKNKFAHRKKKPHRRFAWTHRGRQKSADII